MLKLAYLRITTWVGTVACGQHYYGEIEADDLDKEIDVELVCTESDARKLNVDEEWAHDFKCKGGDTSIRYFDKDRLVSDAVRLFLTHPNLKDFDLLLLGNKYVADPMKPLACTDSRLKARLEGIFDRFKYLGGFDCKVEDEREANRLYRRWRKLLGRE